MYSTVHTTEHFICTVHSTETVWHVVFLFPFLFFSYILNSHLLEFTPRVVLSRYGLELLHALPVMLYSECVYIALQYLWTSSPLLTDWMWLWKLCRRKVYVGNGKDCTYSKRHHIEYDSRLHHCFLRWYTSTHVANIIADILSWITFLEIDSFVTKI